MLCYFVAFSSHLANNLQWIDNPFIALGASFCVCAGSWDTPPPDWYLGSQTEGNTYLRCATSSSPLRGNTDAAGFLVPSTCPFLAPPEGLLCSSITDIRSIPAPLVGILLKHQKYFWRRCRGGEIKIYPSRSHKLFSCIYFCCQLPLVFLSPTSHLPFSFAFRLCRFLLPLPVFLLACVPCAFNMLASSLAENLLIWILIH